MRNISTLMPISWWETPVHENVFPIIVPLRRESTDHLCILLARTLHITWLDEGEVAVDREREQMDRKLSKVHCVRPMFNKSRVHIGDEDARAVLLKLSLVPSRKDISRCRTQSGKLGTHITNAVWARSWRHMNIRFAVIMIVMIRAGPNFAHAMSCHGLCKITAWWDIYITTTWIV